MSYVSRKNWKSGRSGLGYAKSGRSGISRFIIFIILLFIVFELITSFFITSLRVESISMEPAVKSGAVIIASPLIYGPSVPFTGLRIPGIRKPVRGDIVVSSPEYYREEPWYVITLDSFFRFFTLQKKGFGGSGENWQKSSMLKRVMGVPGDTVKMRNFEVFIRPEGRTYFFSEKEIIPVEYSLPEYSPPDGLPPDYPMSGNMEELTLGPGEYFLMGDNRSRSNDSYYWGPVSIDNISSRALVQLAPQILLLQ